jgi:hypothetical protein
MELAIPNSSDNINQQEHRIVNNDYSERALDMGRRLVDSATETKDVDTELGDENEGA